MKINTGSPALNDKPMPALADHASIGLVMLNARYAHMAPAPRILRNEARRLGFGQTWLREYTLQTPVWKMAQDLLAQQPALLGFSIYIWNRRETLELIELIKKLSPQTLTVVGGPEVSFGPRPSPYVDVLIAGEGETKWQDLLSTLSRGQQPTAEQTARWAAYGNDLPPLTDLPYTEEDAPDLAHRLVYLETSRGCPFTCAFCLSALDQRVRFFPEDAVKTHIAWLVAQGARRIKFLDRTFNVRRERTLEFFRWLAGFADCQFHFEIVGDLLDTPLLDFLAQVPPGQFQFEVGIQTTDPAAQNRIARKQKLDTLLAHMARLRHQDRVNLHADLIWGLPGETLADIQQSFRTVFALRPQELQLGFLKFLPGAPIRAQIQAEGYVFQDQPPYEVIQHRCLSALEVLALKRFEEVFDRFYNSGRFRFTLERLLETLEPWALFDRLSRHWQQAGLDTQAPSLDELYRQMALCFAPDVPAAELTDLLRLDYVYHRRVARLPAFMSPAATENLPHPPAGTRNGYTFLAPFGHTLALEAPGPTAPAGRARLLPSPGWQWYAVQYPDAEQGYFFRPTLRPLSTTPAQGPPAA